MIPKVAQEASIYFQSLKATKCCIGFVKLSTLISSPPPQPFWELSTVNHIWSGFFRTQTAYSKQEISAMPSWAKGPSLMCFRRCVKETNFRTSCGPCRNPAIPRGQPQLCRVRRSEIERRLRLAFVVLPSTNFAGTSLCCEFRRPNCSVSKETSFLV